MDAFGTLKKAFTLAPILQPPNWEQPFEIMCDASNFLVGDVLGQRKEGKPREGVHSTDTLPRALYLFLLD